MRWGKGVSGWWNVTRRTGTRRNSESLECMRARQPERASITSCGSLFRPSKSTPPYAAGSRFAAGRIAALTLAAPRAVAAAPPPTATVRPPRPAQARQIPARGTGSLHFPHSCSRATVTVMPTGGGGTGGGTGSGTASGTGGSLRISRSRRMATAECTCVGRPGNRAWARSCWVHPRSSHCATSGASDAASGKPSRSRGSGRTTRNSRAMAEGSPLPLCGCRFVSAFGGRAGSFSRFLATMDVHGR
jgi:hypothetical protein